MTQFNQMIGRGKRMTQDYKTKYPIGSQWKCRDGSRAVVVEHYDYKVLCANTTKTYTLLHDHWCSGDDWELIEPWQEPRTIEGWVNVYNGGDWLHFGEVHRSEVDANLVANKTIIKTIKISYTEGE